MSMRYDMRDEPGVKASLLSQTARSLYDSERVACRYKRTVCYSQLGHAYKREAVSRAGRQRAAAVGIE